MIHPPSRRETWPNDVANQFLPAITLQAALSVLRPQFGG